MVNYCCDQFKFYETDARCNENYHPHIVQQEICCFLPCLFHFSFLHQSKLFINLIVNVSIKITLSLSIIRLYFLYYKYRELAYSNHFCSAVLFKFWRIHASTNIAHYAKKRIAIFDVFCDF